MGLRQSIKNSPIAPPIRFIRSQFVRGWDAVSERMRARNAERELASFDKFHLGAGPRQIPGWANIDVVGRRNIIFDLRRPLPVADASIRYIYTEHFVEHITLEANYQLFLKLRKILRPDGVMRISTPDLAHISEAYSRGEVLRVVHGSGHWEPASPCRMMNEIMRLWDHRFVFDERELRRVLNEAGFASVKRVSHGESEHDALRGLESRPFFGDLIVEAS